MQDGVTLSTKESDLEIKYGPVRYGTLDSKPRELALASVKYILTDLNDIRKRYITLGFHLKEFSRMLYYRDFGYTTMYEFCDANFGMDKSAVSRCISVFEAFSLVEGHTHKMQLDDKYKEYSYSQLCEMVSMSDEERKQIKPDMTIRQIREKKKEFSAAGSSAHVYCVNEFLDVSRDVSPVATSQQKKFDFKKYCELKGAVRQKYIKKIDKNKEAALIIFDRDGKQVTGMRFVDVLEYGKDGLFIRLQNNDEEIVGSIENA